MRLFTAAFLCVLLCCGCFPQRHSTTPEPDNFVAHPPTTTTAPSDGSGRQGRNVESLRPSDVMATVNGKTIYMKDLYGPLVEAHGLQIAEMLIVDEMVDQEAKRMGIVITEKDVEAENNRSLQGIVGEQLAPDQRDSVLEKLLQQRGITIGLWKAVMRRNATLRKIVAPKAAVTEEMIKAEFARQHGESVQISHIQVPSIIDAEKIIKLLEEGKDFAELARQCSTNTATAKQDGILPPFSRETTNVPQAIRDAAFALEPGKISGIVQVGSDFHVLKLNKRITPPAADYQLAKEKLQASIMEQLIGQLKIEKLYELRRKADIEYANPTLRREANREPTD